MVDRVEGCTVLVVPLMVLGATWMLLVAIFATMESTSIMGSIPSFTPPILIIQNLVLDVVITKKGGTKSGTTRSAKAWV